jgi:hypothetical protein
VDENTIKSLFIILGLGLLQPRVVARMDAYDDDGFMERLHFGFGPSKDDEHGINWRDKFNSSNESDQSRILA